MNAFKTFTRITAAMLILGAAHAQNEDTPPDAQAPSKPALVRVATLGTVEANQEFQRNVQFMQGERQRAVELKRALDAAENNIQKKDIQTQLDDVLQSLNDNNQRMIEAYGFSLNRNYVLVVERAHIFMQVNPEEAQRLQNAQEAAGTQAE